MDPSSSRDQQVTTNQTINLGGGLHQNAVVNKEVEDRENLKRLDAVVGEFGVKVGTCVEDITKLYHGINALRLKIVDTSEKKLVWAASSKTKKITKGTEVETEGDHGDLHSGPEVKTEGDHGDLHSGPGAFSDFILNMMSLISSVVISLTRSACISSLSLGSEFRISGSRGLVVPVTSKSCGSNL